MGAILRWYGSVAVGLAITGIVIVIAHYAALTRLATFCRWADEVLQTRVVVVATAVVSGAVIWWFWGSLRQAPIVQDERAYMLQASIFAAGHWTAPSPPLPQFFEQLHVLVTPVVAAKYPPGHSLLLAPGVWVGLPGLGPLLLSAIAGALVFAISRRLAGPWIALMTWFIWVTESANIIWRATYFSETTTATLWLLGWWALLEWRAHRRGWAMACVGACAGWGAITRPMTMLVFAVPVAVVVLIDVYRRHAWRDVVPGLVAATACVAIIPIWNVRTTGDWRRTPLAQYTREYMPWDHPGLGYDSTPPLRGLPADLQSLASGYIGLHRAYTLGAVAPALAARVGYLGGDFCDGWRRTLLVFAVLGLMGITVDVVVGLATASLLILAYLSYAHPASWTLYYLEILPVPAYLAARGIWKCIHPGAPTRAALAVSLLLLAGTPFALSGLRGARVARIRLTNKLRVSDPPVDGLDTGKVLIFVRYGSPRDVDYSIVRNVPDPGNARVWMAYDRGAEDRQLVALAPGRTPYVYDEATRTMSPFAAADRVQVPTTVP